MSWTRPEILSSLALIISALGFVVSLLSFRRTYAAERPVVWLELFSTGIPNCWVVAIHLRNRSNVNLKVSEAWVPIDSIQLTKKQNFWMGERTDLIATGDGKHTLSPEFEKSGRIFKVIFKRGNVAEPGQVVVVEALLFQGPLSAASSVRMEVRTQTVDANPTFKTTVVHQRVPLQ